MSEKKGLENKLQSLGDKVNFIKCQFSDMQGHIREVTVTREIFKGEGITSVDGSSVFGKIIPPTESDMILVPDANTLSIIPWMDDTARIICDVYHPPTNEDEEMKPFEGCPRGILETAEKSMNAVLDEIVSRKFPDHEIIKYHAHFAPEIEFLLLDAEYPIEKLHLDQFLANNHYFIPPKAKVDDALKEMTACFVAMGLKREKYHTEVTSNQYEIGMSHGNVLKIADATMTVKYIIENVAQRHGLLASFIPKFRAGVNGSGMHVHQNLAVTLVDRKKGGNQFEHNLFYDKNANNCLSEIGCQYIAGLLKYAREITAITNPTAVSYKRLVPGCEAPTYIAWDWMNRTALCRGHSEGTKKIRVEYRSPDSKANPYLSFAAMLSAGLSGIEENLVLQAPDKRDFYHDNEGVFELPGNLGESLLELKQSKMLRAKMGSFIVDTLYKLGTDSWKDYCQTVTDHDIRIYL